MMRQYLPESGGWLLISLLGVLAYTSCAAQRNTPAKPASNKPRAFNSDLIARLYSVQPEKDDAFVAHLHDCYMPVWQELRAEHVISSINVFELHQIESTTPETPAWRFLLLAQLDSRAKPGDLLDAETASGCQKSPGSPLFKVLRVEQMSCTPNSCYKMPEPAYRDAPAGIEFLIEFIGVENSLSFLTKYRDLMRTYFGPANGMLVEQGILHSFVALETTEVLFEAPGVPAWNQLHISDDWDVGDKVDWDAVYSELFRREFSRELDDVSA